MVAEVGVAVTSAGVPGGTAPPGVLPGSAAPGAGAQEPFASGVGGPLGGELSAARPQLIRALNGRLLLGHIRDLGPCSRAELARMSGLSKPTVSIALADAERAGLVRTAGQRTGRPGRSALLYEVRPEAGFILGLDVGAQYVRGALADLAGGIRARSSVRSRASSVRGRVGELIGLADGLCAQAGIIRGSITQTVIGSPGLRPAPQRHGADRRAARLGPPRGARATPRGVRALAGGGERCGRGGPGRARPRLRA